MEIQLGRPVFTRDGERAGSVDRLVLNLPSMELQDVIVHKGVLLAEDRIVEPQLIDHVAEDGAVHLNVASDVVHQLPRVVRHAYAAPEPPSETGTPYILGLGGGDPNVLLTKATVVGYEYDQAAGSMFETSPVVGSRLEIQSNLPAESVSIRRGTDVIGSDGRSVGTLDEVIYQDGHVEGFVVASGLLARHSVRIPMSAVKSITHEHIQLGIPAEDAQM